MPNMPPAMLPANDVMESPSAPSNTGTYAPAKEPIVIRIIITVFRDTVTSGIDAGQLSQLTRGFFLFLDLSHASWSSMSACTPVFLPEISSVCR